MSRIREGGFGNGRITPPAVNLARNPWLMPAGYGFSFAVPSGSTNLFATGGPFGGPFARLTHGVASTTGSIDFFLYGHTDWVAGSGATLAGAIPVRPGDVHTFSLYVRTSRANPFFAQLQYLAGSGGAQGTSGGGAVTPVVNTWTRLSGTATAGADAQAVRLDMDLGTPVNWQPGDTCDVACVMISAGPDLMPFSVGSRREL